MKVRTFSLPRQMKHLARCGRVVGNELQTIDDNVYFVVNLLYLVIDTLYFVIDLMSGGQTLRHYHPNFLLSWLTKRILHICHWHIQ